MSRIVTIDSVVVTVENEVIDHKRKDDELETTEIIIKDISQLDPYDMGLEVSISEETTEYYYIGADNVSRSNVSPATYNHRITLIEPYKVFEREMTASLQFTQPLDSVKYTCLDVLDRALKLLVIEKTSDLGGTRVYDISGVGTRDASDDYVVGNLTGFALDLYNKKAPEMQENTPSLRNIFDAVFLLFDGRPILESFDTINIKYYNSKGSAITLTNVDEISGSQNIDKNAQKFDIYMENAVSENNLNKQARVHPSSNAFDSVRSGETELTTNNFLMQVNEDIERVLEFRVYADIDITYDVLGSRQSFSGVINVDMTDWLFTERARNGLLYNFSNTISTGYVQSQYKNNSLYFSGNQIKGWHDSIDIFAPFVNVNLWHLFLATAAYQGGYIPTATSIIIDVAGKPAFAINVREFMFRLKYVPKEVVRVQLERDKNIGFGTLRANQSARIIDTELLGNNMQSKLNREGSKELVFSKTVDSLNSAFDIDDYYGDYNGVKLDNIRYYNGQVLSILTLSEHYSKKSERIDISNRPRQTAISEQNTVRNDIINDYCELSFSVGGTNSSSVTSNGVNRILKAFDSAITTVNPVEFATWEDDLIVEVTSQGIGKTMSCKFEFDDNVTAGVQTTLLDTIYGNKYITYGDANGIIDNATIKFYGSYVANPDTYTNRALTAQMLPEYDTTITLTEQLVNLGERRILKDSGEVYALSYQVTFATDEDEIFIGNKLAQENGFVVKTTEALYLYSQVLPIQLGQNIDITTFTGDARQLLVTTTPTASTQVLATGYTSTAGGHLSFSTNFDSGKHWCVANIKGEVYMIVNKLLEDTIYFNLKEKRSD